MSTWFSVVVTQDGQDSNRNASDRLYCPLGQSGFFADPSNCNRYAHCSDGRRTAFLECLSGLHWHVTGVGYGFCDRPDLAGCQMIGEPAPVPAPDSRVSIAKVRFGPRFCLRSDILLISPLISIGSKKSEAWPKFSTIVVARI